MEWLVGITTGLVGAVVGAASAGVPLYLKLRRDLSGIRREERDNVLEEYDDLISKQKNTLVEVGVELREARIELSKARWDREMAIEERHQCQEMQVRMATRMDYLEDALRTAKIPFREWKPDDNKPRKTVAENRSTNPDRKPPSIEGSDL